MSVKYKIPNEAQREILIRNGIDPDGCIVRLAEKDVLWIERHMTGDEITVRPGVKSRRLGLFDPTVRYGRTLDCGNK